MGMVRHDAYTLLLQGEGVLEFINGLSTISLPALAPRFSRTVLRKLSMFAKSYPLAPTLLWLVFVHTKTNSSTT